MTDQNRPINADRFHPFDCSPAWEAQRRQLRAELGIPEGRRVVVYLGVLAAYQGIKVMVRTSAAVLAALVGVALHRVLLGLGLGRVATPAARRRSRHAERGSPAGPPSPTASACVAIRRAWESRAIRPARARTSSSARTTTADARCRD